MNFLVVTNLILFIVGLINFIFGLVVVLNSKDRTNSQLFFAGLATTVALWTLSMAFYRYTVEYSLLALNILYVIPLGIPFLFVYFVDEYSKQQSLSFQLHFIKRLMFFAMSVLAFLVLFSDKIIVTVTIPEYGEKIITFGSLYWIYVTYFSLTFSIGFFILFKIYLLTQNNLIRRQTLYLLLGTLLSSVLALTTNVILPWLNYFSLNWVGNLATVFFVVLIFYATVFHKLFNLRTAAAETLVIILWLMILIRVAVSQSTSEFLLELTILFATIILGILLIRAVFKEIENREKGERLARYLANANARLRELDKQKTEFVSIVSHQLRSPIAAIKGYASLIFDGSYGTVPEEIKDPMGRILDSGQRISIMVDDFLNVTRIEEGRMSYNMTPQNVCKILNSVVSELQVVANDKGLVLSVTCNENKTLQVKADEGKLKQIFSNLIDNAIKYTQHGSITVSVEKRESENKVLVKIKDTGIGIAPEEVSNLFQKFNRASNANETNVLGTGLGLYIARQILKAHDGLVDVQSEGIGKGSTFTVELPVYDDRRKEKVKI